MVEWPDGRVNPCPGLRMGVALAVRHRTVTNQAGGRSAFTMAEIRSGVEIGFLNNEQGAMLA